MDKKWWFISIGIIALVFIILIFLLAKNKNIEKSPTTGLAECKTISYNGKGKTSIVFFSSKQEAEKYKNALFEISPFNENKNEFNFYYIDDYQPECEIYKGVALLCYNRELVKKAASCPNDIIVVVKDENSRIRSSAYMNVININSKLQTSVFAHEFAHVFANLADEYVPAELPSKAKNCQSDCDKFSVKDGCFEGCSKNNYFRSINAGLMKTLYSKTLGLFNEKLISERINKKENSQSKITGKQIDEQANCENQNYYLVEANYDAVGNIVLISKSLENGCFGNNFEGDYISYGILADGTEINLGSFNPVFIFTDFQSEEQTTIEGEVFVNDNDKSFLLKLPADKSITKIIIKDEATNKQTEISLEDMGARPCAI